MGGGDSLRFRLSMSNLPGIKGYLIDVDGTLLVHDRAIPGAAETLERLRQKGRPFKVTTNITRRSRRDVSETLRREGLEVSPDEILTPARLARQRIVGSGRPRVLLLVPEATRTDFEGLPHDPAHPDWVVVGDLGSEFTWDRLNAAFRAVHRGASLLALHKNRFWYPGPGEPVLDAGAFVTALEYAARVHAEVMGKPSPAFFELALSDLGLTAGEVLVVGDDPESDGWGGRAASCRVALVKTGKFRAGEGPDALGSPTLDPDLILESIADLPDPED